MKRTATILTALLAAALVLAGCGGGGSTSDPAARIPKITLRSPVIEAHKIPALYTCDGKDTPPPLEWGAVPAGTGSLVLIVVGVTPKANSSKFSFSIQWALAGIDPALHKLEPGRLPVGVYVGVASNGKRNYTICPKIGKTEQYQFELYGLPKGAAVSRTFAALPIFAALETANSKSPTDAYGALVATYKRTH